MKKLIYVIGLVLIFTIGLTACSQAEQDFPEDQTDMINTAAAETIQAYQTIIAQEAQVTPSLEVTPTDTPTPPVDTIEPPQPDSTPTITTTPTEQTRCDQADFITETIPDGSVFSPGQPFTKTWTLRNSGTCAWDTNYHVIFFSGNAMGAPAAQQLTSETIMPGEDVTVSFELQAPFIIGTHRGDFLLRNSGGVLFGIGPRDAPFWVEINIPGNHYDFATNYCNPGVTWTSGAGELPCPGRFRSDQGWVILSEEPILEDMSIGEEPGLQVHPQMTIDGWIRGAYPEITLTDDAVFRAIIGCYGPADCDADFSLTARINGGPELILETWHQVQDGTYTPVTVDLSNLAGKRVQFSLLVEARGIPADGTALWLAPRIEPQ